MTDWKDELKKLAVPNGELYLEDVTELIEKHFILKSQVLEAIDIRIEEAKSVESYMKGEESYEHAFQARVVQDSLIELKRSLSLEKGQDE